MANRKRNIQIKIWVTDGERKLIEHKMSLVPTRQIGAYLRKMAIDGYCHLPRIDGQKKE